MEDKRNNFKSQKGELFILLGGLFILIVFVSLNEAYYNKKDKQSTEQFLAIENYGFFENHNDNYSKETVEKEKPTKTIIIGLVEDEDLPAKNRGLSNYLSNVNGVFVDSRVEETYYWDSDNRSLISSTVINEKGEFTAIASPSIRNNDRKHMVKVRIYTLKVPESAMDGEQLEDALEKYKEYSFYSKRAKEIAKKKEELKDGVKNIMPN